MTRIRNGQINSGLTVAAGSVIDYAVEVDYSHPHHFRWTPNWLFHLDFRCESSKRRCENYRLAMSYRVLLMSDFSLHELLKSAMDVEWLRWWWDCSAARTSWCWWMSPRCRSSLCLVALEPLERLVYRARMPNGFWSVSFSVCLCFALLSTIILVTGKCDW